MAKTLRHRTSRNGTAGSTFVSRLDSAAANDPEAIRSLVDEFGPDLTAFARRQGLADPEGTANQALYGAITKIDTLRSRDRSTFRTYLYRIVQRRVVDEIRSNSCRPRTVPGLDTHLGDEPIDEPGSSFDDRIADEDYVDSLLTALTAEQRQILKLRLMDDLSIKETADRTGRSVTAVKAMQRRAITSLRVAAAATAVVLLLVGARVLLTDEPDQGVIVEGPATSPSGDDPRPDDGADEEGLGATEGADGAATDDDADTAGPPEIVGASSRGQGGPTAPTATDATTTETGDAPPQGDGAEDGAPSGTDPDPGTTDPDGDDAGEPEPTEPPPPELPCRIITDRTPRAGEIGWLRLQFTGPFELFRQTSVGVVDPDGTSLLLTGFGSPERVGNGRTLPFAIGEHMFDDRDRFKPEITLAGGAITTPCELVTRNAAPCTVTTDGTPAPGEEATVTYALTGPYGALDERWTAIIAGDGSSAMAPNGGTREITDGSSHPFVLDASMIGDDGELDVRSSFRSGEGFITCAAD